MSRRSMLPMLLLLAASLGFVGCGNEPPQVVIASLQDGQHFVPGGPVVFSGTAEDEEDGALAGEALVWMSDQGRSNGCRDLLPEQHAVSRVTHRITLTAEDSDGESGSAQVTIVVNGLPTHRDHHSVNGVLVRDGGDDHVRRDRHGRAGQPAVRGVAGLVLGPRRRLRNRTTVVTDALSEHTHEITLTATDSAGDSASVAIVVVVSDAPLPAIATPANGARYERQQDIVFTGSARDAQDGVLPGGGLIWSSDLDGEFGTGSPVTTSSLSQGTHVITLKATDSDNRITERTIVVILEPLAPPVVTVLRPHSGTFYASATTVTFEGRAVDEQDGELTGAALVWHSNRQGLLGEG